MSFDWASVGADVAGVIAELGKPVSLRRTTSGAYDPLAGTYTGGSDQNTSVTVVIDEITDEYSARVGGNNIDAKDKLFIMAAGPIVPNTGDKFIDGADTWSIVNIETTSPGGVDLLYEIQVRP